MKILILFLLMCLHANAAWDFGASAADRINTSTAQSQVARSYSIWFYRDGLGGGSLGALFTGQLDLNKAQINSSTTIRITFDWTTDGTWDISLPSIGVWHHFALTYDGSSTVNDPLVYIDGMSVTVTQIVNPVGAAFIASGNIMYGNLNTNVRNWDGRIAEAAMWNRVLSASEVVGLAKGLSPAFYLNGMTSYFPLVRGTQDYKVATDGVATGAVSFDSHPPMRYPSADFSVAFISTSSPVNILNLNNRRRRE